MLLLLGPVRGVSSTHDRERARTSFVTFVPECLGTDRHDGEGKYAEFPPAAADESDALEPPDSTVTTITPR